MSENPYQSPLADDEPIIDSEAEEQRLRELKALQRWLPMACVWHVAFPVAAMLLDPVKKGPVGEALLLTLGLSCAAFVFLYLLWFTTRIWPLLFAVLVSLLGVYPIAGLLAIGLAAYRSRLVLRGEQGTLV